MDCSRMPHRVRSTACGMRDTERKMHRGFTLIELLVVTGIIVIVTAVVLANNNQYGGQVLLQSFAYDVALSIRQAQVYGISVQRFGSGASANFGAGYGMHFDTAALTSYILFADAVTADGLYQGTLACPQQPGAGSEFAECSSIGRGYAISKLCAPAGSDAASCTAVQKLDILFIRPEPDALIAANDLQCYGAPSPACQPSARIVLQSPRGDTMSVSVQANGQIAVDQIIAATP